MQFITLLLLLPFPFFTLPKPPRDYREVLRDIERLEASGDKRPEAYDKLADEITRGIYNF